MENETELERRERLRKEKEDYDNLVRGQLANRSAEERARIHELDRQSREAEIQRKADDEKRKRREEEIKKAREEIALKRKRQEDALRLAQQKFEDEKRRIAEIALADEGDLIRQQKEMLELERKIAEQKQALSKHGEETGYFRRPVFEEFEALEEEKQRERSVKFVVNPQWGINSLDKKDGSNHILVHMRRLKHITHAPQNLHIQKPCVLVVFTDCSFLCVRERAYVHACICVC